MKVIAALATVGIQIVAAQTVKDVAAVDCSGVNPDAIQVFSTSYYDRKVEINAINWDSGAVASLGFAARNIPNAGGTIENVDACAISPKTHYLYCSVLTGANTYHLARVDPRPGQGLAFCATYDMTPAGLDRVGATSKLEGGAPFAPVMLLPQGADFTYVDGTSTYYSSVYQAGKSRVGGNDVVDSGDKPENKENFLWSIVDPDSLTCYQTPDAVPIAAKMKLVTNILATGTDSHKMGYDFVVQGNEFVTIDDGNMYAISIADPVGTSRAFTSPVGGDSLVQEIYNSVWASNGNLHAHTGNNPLETQYYSIDLSQNHQDPNRAVSTAELIGSRPLPTVDTNEVYPNKRFGDGAYCPTTPCRCRFGIAPPKYCPMNAPQMCVSCNEGHTLDNNLCTTCGAGFHANKFGKCEPNTCVCVDGTPASGADCATDGLAKCIACNPGYAINTDAATDAIVCRKCDETYHLVGDKCVKNQCHCEHGDVDDDACTQHLEESCSSCDAGLTLVGNKCEASEVPPDMGSMPEVVGFNGAGKNPVPATSQNKYWVMASVLGLVTMAMVLQRRRYCGNQQQPMAEHGLE